MEPIWRKIIAPSQGKNYKDWASELLLPARFSSLYWRVLSNVELLQPSADSAIPPTPSCFHSHTTKKLCTSSVFTDNSNSHWLPPSGDTKDLNPS